MAERIIEKTPRFKARIAGLFYLVTFVTAIFAELFVQGRLVVDGDAAATATNILAHEFLFRSGVAADLIGISCYVAVTALYIVKTSESKLVFTRSFLQPDGMCYVVFWLRL